jgi:hypothetical protein
MSASLDEPVRDAVSLTARANLLPSVFEVLHQIDKAQGEHPVAVDDRPEPEAAITHTLIDLMDRVTALKVELANIPVSVPIAEQRRILAALELVAAQKRYWSLWCGNRFLICCLCSDRW